ncbi:YeeE/YedE family protein [Agrobacterium larrymoorei]|uniref:Membrane protein YedE/YeeE n=1 Tax=Agrobacterium larrymoorei TaxID=160699 RepID=A0ABU0UP54_9HYPH|nr:YeeE/YedE family protein [Agrobacterium larrymoorei]MDQ1186751.1 putative membrane protein YedE/YeeE [Agrobacterium larrymoorei]
MNRSILQFSAALASGLIFGLGLSLSGMLNPARVQAFLDVFGHWDPSLAFVLGGAVLIAFIGVRVAKRMEHPVLDDRFHLSTNQKIDAPLIIGSALFGLGWGLGGFCPGPAIASLSVASLTGSAPQVVLFVVAMLIGMMLHDRLWNRRL